MAAQLADILAGVVTLLNAGSTAQAFGTGVTFTATRSYTPQVDLKNLDSISVTVAPAALDQEPESRSSDQIDYQIQVGIQKKAAGNSEVDALILIMQKVIQYIRREPLSGSDAKWLRTSWNPIYSADHLREKRLFLSVATITYRSKLGAI